MKFKKKSKMVLNVFNLIKHMNIVVILVLIMGCIYYLVTAVQIMQQILEQLERAQRLEGSGKVPSVLTRQAKTLYERHEVSLIYQIIICSSTTALSLLGLMSIVRENLTLVLIYATMALSTFVANFFLPSNLKPWLMVLMALVSIISFSFSYAIRRRKTSASLDVNLPQVYFHRENVESNQDDFDPEKSTS